MGVHLRIQLCLILRRLGLPRDLRQLLIRKVWFDCQSEVLRQERISLVPNERQKFSLPILEKVEKFDPMNSDWLKIGTIGTNIFGRWIRYTHQNIDDVMTHGRYNSTMFPSLLWRLNKKLKI